MLHKTNNSQSYKTIRETNNQSHKTIKVPSNQSYKTISILLKMILCKTINQDTEPYKAINQGTNIGKYHPTEVPP